MPPKKTYGKKAQSSFYAPSFSWSSPGKTSPEQNIPTWDLNQGMRNLSLAQEKAETIQRKRALRTRDSNAMRLVSAAEPDDSELNNNKNCQKHLEGPQASLTIKSAAESGNEGDISKTLAASVKFLGNSSQRSSRKSDETQGRDILTEYVRPLLNLCSDPAARATPNSFLDWSFGIDEHFDITKIAEASYGEVYRLSLKANVPGFSKTDESVMKLIALKPPAAVDLKQVAQKSGDIKRNKQKPDRVSEQEEGTSWMSSIEAVVSEVRLLRRMTTIPGFTNFREVRILRGRPGRPFVAAWKAFNKAQPRGQKSIYPDPSRKLSYTDDQIWAVIEMQDAGTDLERVQLSQVWSVWDVFWGVTIAIAKGEENAQFEHRDLHLGNVCIRSARGEDITAPSIKNTAGKLGFTGLETSIIDYTLSRAEMRSAIESDTTPFDLTASNEKGADVAFLDLALDPELFNGDGAVDYQYDIYRYMRSMFLHADPLATDSGKEASRHWSEYCPGTNVVWLHFVLHSLLSVLTSSGSQILDLHRLTQDENRKIAAKKAAQLRRRLHRLNEALDFRIEQNESSEIFESASEIVEWAVEVGWLDEADVLGSA